MTFQSRTATCLQSIKKRIRLTVYLQPTLIQVVKINYCGYLPICSLLIIIVFTLQVIFLNSSSTVERGIKGKTLLFAPNIVISSAPGDIFTSTRTLTEQHASFSLYFFCFSLTPLCLMIG